MLLCDFLNPTARLSLCMDKAMTVFLMRNRKLTVANHSLTKARLSLPFLLWATHTAFL